VIHKWHLKLEFTNLATSLTFGIFMLDNGGGGSWLMYKFLKVHCINQMCASSKDLAFLY